MLWRNKIENYLEYSTIYSPIHLTQKAYKETNSLKSYEWLSPGGGIMGGLNFLIFFYILKTLCNKHIFL